ncbi:MAG: nitrite/sulfite reductase, partial [Edaphobacter sp.]
MTTPSEPAIKETKAQKTERLKLAKNPWEAFDEIRQFARDGRDSVPDEWALYFRWWGVYSQGDGLGLAGGKNGEGKATEFFMLRIGLPNGLLTSHQLRVIAGITKKFARNLADITTRQNIQLHWLTIADLVEVVDTLTEIGLSPKGACGDVVRNVTGCPLAGINHDELIDASPLAVVVAKHLTANTAFYNLPRKFKISVSGCPLWCNYPEINDVALTAIKHVVDGKGEVGYTLRVGGGLSTEPHIAARIPAFVRQDQALAVVLASAEIFRDADVLRENRMKARSKYLFMRFGWTPESYLEVLEAKLGYKLIPSPAEDENIADDIYRDHIGITPQRQPGLSSVGASVLRGRVSGDQLHQLADLADKYGNGELRTTIMQNIIIVNVP